jgi:predicted CopG family antitoxin
MKTVTFDDEAYNLLKGAKLSPQESFSDVVKRHFGRRRSLVETAGAWRDMTAADARALRDESRRAFEGRRA